MEWALIIASTRLKNTNCRLADLYYSIPILPIPQAEKIASVDSDGLSKLHDVVVGHQRSARLHLQFLTTALTVADGI